MYLWFRTNYWTETTNCLFSSLLETSIFGSISISWPLTLFIMKFLCLELAQKDGGTCISYYKAAMNFPPVLLFFTDFDLGDLRSCLGIIILQDSFIVPTNNCSILMFSLRVKKKNTTTGTLKHRFQRIVLLLISRNVDSNPGPVLLRFQVIVNLGMALVAARWLTW